jgi:shikimate kinase
MSQKIILIGYMGSGKTTLGEKLARELKIPFIDSDEVIEQIAKMDINTIFKEHGEAVFRKMESMFLESLLNIPAFVLSTGGGLPCFNNNMDVLNDLGNTIYLKNSAEGLAERLLAAKTVRPLIAGKSKNELIPFIEDNLNKREPYYSKAELTLNLPEQDLLNVMHLVSKMSK